MSKKWFGSAGVCINENGELLMVLQGKPEEEKSWSIPSGGKDANESFEHCCIREIKEETGYEAVIVKKINVKKDDDQGANLSVEVHYYLAKVIGGTMEIQDPDQLIYEVAWKKFNEIKNLELSFPKDRQFLLNCIETYKETSRS